MYVAEGRDSGDTAPLRSVYVNTYVLLYRRTDVHIHSDMIG